MFAPWRSQSSFRKHGYPITDNSFIRDIHTRNSRENRLGWLHTRHKAINQKVNFYFRRKRKTVISPSIFSLFQKFFSEIRDYSSTTTLTQKSKFEENYRPEGKL